MKLNRYLLKPTSQPCLPEQEGGSIRPYLRMRKRHKQPYFRHFARPVQIWSSTTKKPDFRTNYSTTTRNCRLSRCFGDSRLKYITHYVNKVNNTQALIKIIDIGGATIRSTGSVIWYPTHKHRHDVIFFMAGINDMTVWDELTQRYKLPFVNADEATEHFIGSYQHFERTYHVRFPRSHVLFATLTDMDISTYTYVQDPDTDHQDIVKKTVQRVNQEIVNIN